MPTNATKWILGFVMMSSVAIAQPIRTPLGSVANDADAPPPVRRAWVRDITTYTQIGWQYLNLNALNEELVGNGYSPFGGDFRSLGFGCQFRISPKPFYLHIEASQSINSRFSGGNGNRASLSVSSLRLGMSYRALRKGGFELLPHAGVMSMPIRLKVQTGTGQLQQPTLTSILKNPGASGTSQLNTTAGAVDLGLTANYRFSIQRQYDDCTNYENSLLVALDGGYRIGSRPEFLTETSPAQRITFPSSGWYIGVRIGASLRSDRGKK
jgi:hypothetical protein